MRYLTCPHCGSNRFGANRVPKDVVVVLPCPSCHELVVVFRNKVAAANREILENGSREERKAHIAEIVMEFLDSLVFRALPPTYTANGREPEPSDEELDETLEDLGDAMAEAFSADDRPARRSPISQREVDRFVKFDLQRIDDARYFKKHFS